MSRTPSPTPSTRQSTLLQSAKTSLASSKGSESEAAQGDEKGHHTFARGLGRFFFKSNSSSSKRDSIDSGRSDDGGRSPNCSRPTSPMGRPKSPQQVVIDPPDSRITRRSIRKSQWRFFKHRTLFGSQRSTKKKNNQLQLPKLTLRHPSIDSAAMMPLPLDDVEGTSYEGTSGSMPSGSRLRGLSATSEGSFLQIRRSSQRRWTDSDTSGRLNDSRDSSDFNDSSHDTLDVVVGSSGSTNLGAGGVPSGTSGASDQHQHHHHRHHHQQHHQSLHSMTAPVSPSVPLSASSSHSEGWKYSSQKLLWKLKPRYINFSHASSTSSSTDSAWKSLDSMTWRSVDGAEVVLRGARLETLSEIERSALLVLATQRLARMLPGVNLGKPKDPLSVIRQKRQKLVKSNRTPSVADVQRRASATPLQPDEKRVFGVSLAMCMLNEKRLDQESRCRSLDDSTVCMMQSGRKPVAKPVKSEPEIQHQPTPDDRKWLYPSTQNLYPTCSSNPASPSPLAGSAPPIMSPSHHLLSAEPEVQTITGRFAKKTRPSSASFSLSLDVSVADDVDPHALQVPRIVENCTQYLMTYGLNQVGLFRVAGNNKRCRQLRNALEKVGGGTAINDNMVENTTAHDVATLLKEYFRDLPQSLLPKEHYQAYIAAAKLNIEERIEAIRLLFALLVSPNLDTLFVLLKFLHEVSLHCHDRPSPIGDDEEIIQGNKMDARNLATIFAPSILRPDHDKLQDSLAENDQQITVVETMIINVEEIFKIPKELQCKIYTKLRETEPDRLDRILNYLSKMDSHDHTCLLSPLSATMEEDSGSPRSHHRNSDHSHIGRQSPLAMEPTPNGKVKVQSQRSGSWPFSLTRTQTSPNRQESSQHFFPSDDPVETTEPHAEKVTKSATTTPAQARRSVADYQQSLRVSCPIDGDSGRESAEYCSEDLVDTVRSRAETVCGSEATTSANNNNKRNPNIGNLAGTVTSKSVDARSPSRERVDTFRTAARSSAAAARRRLRNVVRALRWTSHARSSPDIAQTS